MNLGFVAQLNNVLGRVDELLLDLRLKLYMTFLWFSLL